MRHAASFSIHLSAAGGTTYDFFDSTPATSPGQATYTATGMTPGMRKFYLTAENASGGRETGA
jgi:hypothetical protein